MKIKVKLKDYATLPEFIEKGDWVDLRASEICEMNKGDFRLIGLGVAMKLPKGFEAHVIPRSSTFKNTGLIMVNSVGIIDNSYCGNDDEWKFPALASRDVSILHSDRICQFRIALSQRATFLQKLRWLLSSRIDFVKTDQLSSENRGGFGSTGMK